MESEERPRAYVLEAFADEMYDFVLEVSGDIGSWSGSEARALLAKIAQEAEPIHEALPDRHPATEAEVRGMLSRAFRRIHDGTHGESVPLLEWMKRSKP